MVFPCIAYSEHTLASPSLTTGSHHVLFQLWILETTMGLLYLLDLGEEVHKILLNGKGYMDW